MRIFYHNQISENDNYFLLDKNESKHILKVLRKKINDIIHLTNGKGYLFKVKIFEIIDNKCNLKIVDKIYEKNNNYKINVAIAPTKSNERTEWFLEKSTEIGIESITPIICYNSERRSIKAERFDKILISAMKQSERFYKPKLDTLVDFKTYIKNCKSELKLIAYCNENKNHLSNYLNLNNKNISIIIGPEGGFSESEINYALKMGFKTISLGKKRLRTETAGIVAVQILSSLNL
jgi:16S rRNA (uracil1498-N3)-methyltransferase